MSIKMPPLDLDSGHVSRHFARDPVTKEHIEDSALNRLVGAAGHMQAQSKSLHELASAIVGDRSYGGHAARLKFGDTATRALAEADKRMDEAMKAVFTMLGALDRSTKPTAPLNFLGSEIRARLAAMKPEQRRQVLADADDATIGAIAHAPVWLSGVAKAEADMILRTWSEKRYPDESARMRRLGAALESARRVGVSFKSYVEDLSREMTTPAVGAAKRTEAAQQAVVAAE